MNHTDKASRPESATAGRRAGAPGETGACTQAGADARTGVRKQTGTGSSGQAGARTPGGSDVRGGAYEPVDAGASGGAHGHEDASPRRRPGPREDTPVDLVAALARARSAEPPGPETRAGPAVRTWPGPPRPLPPARDGVLDLRTLLRLSLAASDTSERLRPAPSAGALHPVDTELVVGTGCSLPPGRYGYDPVRHRVHRLGPPPGNTPPGVRAELTVTARRTASHYGHRARPLLLLDTGHAAAALLMAARALGARPEADLSGSTESPLAVVHVPAPDPTPGLSPGPTSDLSPRPIPDLSPGPTSDLSPGPAPARDGAPPTRTADAPAPRELLERRSAPPPLTGSPPPEALRDVLDTAVAAGGGTLDWCAAVGGPRPGLVEPAADATVLRRRAFGEARPTLAVWAAGQRWLADAGAVLLALGCPDDADAPHIRRAHLRAGFAVHLAHLTARRHGLAARPVGSWQRADLGAALGAAPGREWIVHGLALGTHHADEENTT